MSRKRRLLGGVTAAALAGTTMLFPALSHAVREDCDVGREGCGWQDAYFTNLIVHRGQIGNYNFAGTVDDNRISSIYNRGASNRAIWYDYAGSSSRVCVRPGYENSNLAGSTLQDDISYLQITSFHEC